MKKTKEDSDKPFLHKIADGLLEAQQEIDDLALQLSLGKAEAKEKFEGIKKEFRNNIGEFRRLLEETPHKLITPEIKKKVQELEVQLALGKAETKEEFEEQRKKLLRSIALIEKSIKKWLKNVDFPPSIESEMEKFKLKLEIVRLKYSLKKFELRDDFKEHMRNAKMEIEKNTSKAKSKLQIGKRKYEDFADEISSAYDHLKKAVKHLG
ncbi:MAG TPA: hypothetical protein PK185_04740 [Cyclobacteriaceae bacterium]|nr:hypothetical protein [Cyclobacteriaceae bacterium]